MSQSPSATAAPVIAPFDVARLREAEFPWMGELAYLNSASTGPLPQRTRRVLDEFNDLRTMPHRLSDPMIFEGLARTRRLVARLVNADPAEIALAINTGYGLDLAARALPLEPGDVVLASDREFPANVYPWMRLADRGVTLELVPTTAEGWPDEARLLERLADPRVRVLAISLVQFSTGWKADLARLSAAARAHDAFFVVDAIQGLGQVPVDLGAVPVDILACGGQKWLLSPWGSGFVYVRRELIEGLEPPLVSWMAFEGTDDFSRLTAYDDTWRADARRFELVTLPFQEFAGLAASLELILELGVERIAAHAAALRERLHAWAADRGVRIASPTGEHASAIVCLAPPRPAEAHAALREASVVSSLREGAIRFALHGFNTAEEIARVTAVLDEHV